MLKSIIKQIKKIDLFARPIELKKKKNKYSSLLGAIISIFIYIICLVVLSNDVFGVVNKLNPNIS